MTDDKQNRENERAQTTPRSDEQKPQDIDDLRAQDGTQDAEVKGGRMAQRQVIE